MKQTQTHVWSLAGEEAGSYSLARGKAAAVTRESGEVAAYSLARAVSLRSCTWAVPRWDRGKTPKPRCLAAFSRPRVDTYTIDLIAYGTGFETNHVLPLRAVQIAMTPCALRSAFGI